METNETAAASGNTEWITACYRQVFPAVARYISRRGGTWDEASDIFQDSLVILFEKKKEGRLPEHIRENAYLFGIAKHGWSRYCETSRRSEQLGENAETIPEPETESQPVAKKLLRLLETGGQRCLDLLKAFYYDKLPPEKAAEQFGYSGVRSVTVQKYKCLEKIRNEVKTKALSHADFLA